MALGVALWALVHFVPGVARGLRTGLIDRLGPQAYQGIFSLSLIIAIVLMVVGWRGIAPSTVYVPPAWGRAATEALVFVALFLFAASGIASNVKRILRHPQLLGFAVWAGSHLLANGEQRSLLLFSGLGAWAVAEMFVINRRDGAWEKPDPEPAAAVLKPLAAAVVVYALLWFAHPYITGLPA